MRGDGSVKRPDEFITDLFERGRYIPCQFRPYYIQVIRVIPI